MADRAADPERELVARCLKGDRQAWHAFVIRYTPLLAGTVRRAFRRLGVPEDPERVQDRIQDLFVLLLRDDAAALGRFRWECPLPQYLMTVAARQAVLSMRREFAAPGREEIQARLLQGVDDASFPEGAELRGGMDAALETLSPRERLALRWFYWDSLSAREIGRLLSQREEAVWMLLSRARARLRDALERSGVRFSRHSQRP